MNQEAYDEAVIRVALKYLPIEGTAECMQALPESVKQIILQEYPVYGLAEEESTQACIFSYHFYTMINVNNIDAFIRSKLIEYEMECI